MKTTLVGLQHFNLYFGSINQYVNIKSNLDYIDLNSYNISSKAYFYNLLWYRYRSNLIAMVSYEPMTHDSYQLEFI